MMQWKVDVSRHIANIGFPNILKSVATDLNLKGLSLPYSQTLNGHPNNAFLPITFSPSSDPSRSTTPASL